jgi:uncharacterized repeat protein (TIGR01451 family)
VALAALAAVPAAAQGGDAWQPVAPMLTPRRLLAAAGEGGKVYTFGGCGSPCFAPPSHISTFEETRVEMLDPADGSWVVLGPLPAVVFGAGAAAPGNDRIYLAGGFVTGSLLLEYAPATDSWSTRAPLPTPRHGLAVVALGGSVYALGGSDGTAPSAAVERYDPAADRWTPLAPLPTPRVFLAAAASGGKIYAVGGSPDCCGGAATAAVDVYDPATNAWSSAAPMPVAMQVSAAAALNGKVYVFGGFVPGAGAQGATFEYDPAADAWTARAPLRTPRDQAPAVVVDGKAYVTGGSVDCHCRALAVGEKYTPPKVIPPKSPRADLFVTKDDGVGAVAGGDVVRYHIEAGNLGPDPVAGARVRDVFPGDRLADVTWTCAASDGGACGRTAGTGQIDERVDLPVGGSVAYAATGTVLPVTACPAATFLRNTATVAAPAGVREVRPGNDRATDSDALRLAVDLAVKVDVEPSAATAGEDLTIVVTVENKGPDAACGATVRVVLPAALLDPLVRCEAAGGAACGGIAVVAPSSTRGTQVAGTLIADVDLPPGSEVVYRIAGRAARRVTCEPLPPLLVTATVEPPPGVEELDRGDNQATGEAEHLPGEPEVTLELGKSDGVDAAAAGDELTYVIRLDNQGPDALCGAILRDPLPAELTSAAWRCAKATAPACAPAAGGAPAAEVPLAPGEAVVARVSVEPGGAVEVELRGTVACGPTAELRNTATVALADGTVLRESTDVDALACDADLALTKSTAAPHLLAGGAASFTLVARNFGPGPVAGARVRDPVPAGLTGVAWTCSPAPRCDPAAGQGAVDARVDLAAGEAATFTVTGTVAADPPCEIVNLAEIEPPQGIRDPKPGNNLDTVTLTAFPAPPGVQACKTVSGECFEGGVVTYTLRLLNPGPFAQADNPGDELTDTLPPQVALLGATATSGMVGTAGNMVTWNGAVPVLGTVTLEIDARVEEGTLGETVCNQAILATDPDGDGVNDTVVVSDDPGLPGAADETCFRVVTFLAKVPALSPTALAALAALLAAEALLVLGRRRSTPR